jgi:hypothetical protein
MDLSADTLKDLEQLSERGDPPPWISRVEGRDHLSGDSFLQVGNDGDRREDIYVFREAGIAGHMELDLIAAARNYLPAMIDEIRTLRGRLNSLEMR